jgi:hypothetical protein
MTFASLQGVQSGNCLTNTQVAGQGEDSWGENQCPGKTTGFSTSNLLAGPTPQGGAIVTRLYATLGGVVRGKDTATVAVIDNTTAGTLLSCTVTSASKGSCSSSGPSGPVAEGDYIEVKVMTSGPSGADRQWRVSFRY